jgi:hypothetical protein
MDYILGFALPLKCIFRYDFILIFFIGNHEITTSKIASQNFLMKTKQNYIIRSLGFQIVKLSPKQL